MIIFHISHRFGDNVYVDGIIRVGAQKIGEIIRVFVIRIQPVIKFARVQNYRHPVVNGFHHLVGGGGDDRIGLAGSGIIRSQIGIDAGKTHKLVPDWIDVMRGFAAFLPVHS